ncbi:hypothetical protein [Nostoc sp.]|uniref:hypothetical protein n=1 Tax=Nostoc sp. TaxID=1180 RepID=UPI002FF86198
MSSINVAIAFVLHLPTWYNKAVVISNSFKTLVHLLDSTFRQTRNKALLMDSKTFGRLLAVELINLIEFGN